MTDTLRELRDRVPFAQWLAADEEMAAASPIHGRPGDTISFGGGLPAPELFPTEAMERAFSQAIREDAARSLQYGPTEGIPELRAIVAERLARRGIEVSADQVLITSGSLQGLNLVGGLLLDTGDVVITEAPTFMGALGAWAIHSPHYLSVAVDEEGMRLDVLEELLRTSDRPPKLVYVLPTFQNPTGVTLTLERRRGLLELAHRYGFWIVEDDPYGELWFDEGAPEVAPIRALPGAEERVLYLGSFSKILAPGLRLGFTVASGPVMHRLVRVKRGSDFHTDAVTQFGVLHLVAGKGFDLDAHVAGLRRAYREHRDTMLDTLETTFPAGVSWTRPSGGFFLWVELPPPNRALDFLALAQAEGVSFIPGPTFYPNGGGSNALRLSFSSNRPERIAEGVRRLARAAQRLSR